MRDLTKGLLITTAGVLLVVPDSLFVRVIDAPPMTTAFWRSLAAGLVVLLFVLLRHGPQATGRLREGGWPVLAYILLIGSTSPAFVLAVTQTSVANVVFIFASMPVFAALWSRILLGESLSRRIAWTMLPVLAGLALIAQGAGGSDEAHWTGDLWALYISCAYAAALTLLRKSRDVLIIPAVPLAYLGAALVIAMIWPIEPNFRTQGWLYFGHGLFIGAATCLLAIGPRYITSAEVSLLVLLESVLAPLLVWAVIGEVPGPWTLFGGSIMILALFVSNLVALRRMRVTKPA